MRRRNICRIYNLLAVSLFIVLLAAPAFSSSAKVWVGRAQEFEDVLTTGDIVAIKDLGEGRNQPKKVTLSKNGLELNGIWKPIERGRHDWAWETYQAEVVAYQLDKLLGLNMVPPTVEREFQGNRGSCQLWITVEMDMRKKTREKIETPPDKAYSWNRAIYLQRAFDNLIANIDRHQGNILITKDWRMILIDHSRSFGTYPTAISKLIYTEKHKDGPKIMRQLPRAFIVKIKDLNIEKISDVVGVYLTVEEIEAVLKRRDLILEEINRIIKIYGEDNVLY